MPKIFYFDTETTGTDPIRNAIIQLAYIVEIDGEVKEEGNLLIQPYPADVIEDEALQINKRTKEEIVKEPFIAPAVAYNQIQKMLLKYIDKYNRQDKFYPAGYNVSFDCNFLSQFFVKNKDKYFGSFFNGRHLDPRVLIAFMDLDGKVNMDNHKLETVCNYFKIPLSAHDAMSDIRATRQLIKRLIEKNVTFAADSQDNNTKNT